MAASWIIGYAREVDPSDVAGLFGMGVLGLVLFIAGAILWILWILIPFVLMDIRKHTRQTAASTQALVSAVHSLHRALSEQSEGANAQAEALIAQVAGAVDQLAFIAKVKQADHHRAQVAESRAAIAKASPPPAAKVSSPYLGHSTPPRVKPLIHSPKV